MCCFFFEILKQDSLEYERYLKEVINVLETDPEFRKKLDNATDVDIRVCKLIVLYAKINFTKFKLVLHVVCLVCENSK